MKLKLFTFCFLFQIAIFAQEIGFLSNNITINQFVDGTLLIPNTKDKPDSLELSLLEAYQYNIEKGLSIESNIKDPHDGKYLLYTKPIMIDNPLCLQCHGEIGKELSEETHQLIKELYPQDMATNYKMSELRGMWSIKLSKRNLILSEF